jgi:hypothetical protein
MLKLIVAQLLQKFFAPYGTQGLITIFTRHRRWTLHSDRSVAVEVSSSETFHDQNARISHVPHACCIPQLHHTRFGHLIFGDDLTTSLVKRQFVVTHTIRQTEIPAMLNSWTTNTPSVSIFCPHKSYFLYFRKT